MKVYIGTSGYSYQDWVGPFYPENISSTQFLNFYQKNFCFTELNFSYYTQPTAKNMEKVVSTVHEDFRFSIKAHQSLTHVREEPKENAEVFLKGIQPLWDSGKLLAILFQFPYSFHYEIQNRHYLKNLCGLFSGYPLVFEFRNQAWYTEAVFKGLVAENAAAAQMDQPRLPGLAALDFRNPASMVYLRMHGRNAANWWKGDNATRYDYLYNQTELKELAESLRPLVLKTKILVIAFNNHLRGQAVQNAQELITLLEPLL